MTPDNLKDIKFHDVSRRLQFEGDNAIIHRTQHVDDQHLQFLADHQTHSASAPMGDFHLAASIPAAVVEKWFAEGFNIFDENNKLEDIMKRLQKEDMERLIATSKRLY